MSLAAAVADPRSTDVVTAILGASAALGGFGLVFLGILISAYQGYPADTPKSVKDRRRRAVWPVLAVFTMGIAEIALSLIWLAVPGGECLYHVVVWTFAVLLAGIVGVAIYTTVRMLK